MKFILIVSVIISVAYGQSTSEICGWQSSRDNLIKSLTSAGQKAANQILLDLQLITGAAIQPLCNYVYVEHKMEIDSILNSTDSSRLIKLGSLFGCGNISSGAGPLIDVCQESREIDAVLASVSSANRQTVSKILETFNNYFMYGLKPILSINRLLDASLYSQLEQTENKTTLAALAALYE